MSTRGEGAGPRRPPYADHTGQSCPRSRNGRQSPTPRETGKTLAWKAWERLSYTLPTHATWAQHHADGGPQLPPSPGFYSPHLSDGPPNTWFRKSTGLGVTRRSGSQQAKQQLLAGAQHLLQLPPQGQHGGGWHNWKRFPATLQAAA